MNWKKNISVTYPTINRWENGHFQPSPLAMEKIERKLDEMGEQRKNLANK
ncbi:helix-turn-helix domain-containing protein [Cylindrospermum stagnale]|nr:helix-turn-helix transcriptional regulator [Cylindrospermum stagnale]